MGRFEQFYKKSLAVADYVVSLRRERDRLLETNKKLAAEKEKLDKEIWGKMTGEKE